mgnify:FL=1
MNEIKRENDLRTLVKKILEKENVFCQPIESGGTRRGIPDMYCLYKGFSFWIEFKIGSIDLIEKRYFSVTFQAGQKQWHAELRNNLGVSFFWIYDKQKNVHYITHSDEKSCVIIDTLSSSMIILLLKWISSFERTNDSNSTLH